MSPDLAPSLRAALAAAPGIGDMLDQWKGEPAIFTRRPVPADAPALFILINPDAAVTNADGLATIRLVVDKDIAVYGDNPRQYREVEEIARRIHTLFHRQKWAIVPDGYRVMDMVASGPIPGPTDDENQVARIVGLHVNLRSA